MKIWDYESDGDDHLSNMLNKDETIAFTKPSMAIHLLSLINFKEGDEIMEPCYGDGAFFNNLPSYTINHYCEINMGIDYLTQNKMVDYTLSNPPFVPRKLFWSFHQKAMETTRKEIYWLINISSLNVFTTSRLEEMNKNGWYIQSLHIVNDKRWYGRYVWVKFSKEKSDLFTFHNKSF